MKCIGIIGANGTGSCKNQGKKCRMSQLHPEPVWISMRELWKERKQLLYAQESEKINAGMCTQILADLFDVTHIINTGIAGSLDAQIDIGDIVVSTDVLQS